MAPFKTIWEEKDFLQSRGFSSNIRQNNYLFSIAVSLNIKQQRRDCVLETLEK
jgi:hypothetical protein